MRPSGSRRRRLGRSRRSITSATPTTRRWPRAFRWTSVRSRACRSRGDGVNSRTPRGPIGPDASPDGLCSTPRSFDASRRFGRVAFRPPPLTLVHDEGPRRWRGPSSWARCRRRGGKPEAPKWPDLGLSRETERSPEPAAVVQEQPATVNDPHRRRRTSSCVSNGLRDRRTGCHVVGASGAMRDSPRSRLRRRQCGVGSSSAPAPRRARRATRPFAFRCRLLHPDPSSLGLGYSSAGGSVRRSASISGLRMASGGLP